MKHFRNDRGRRAVLLSLTALFALTGCRSGPKVFRAEEDSAAFHASYPAHQAVTDPALPLMRIGDATGGSAAGGAAPISVSEAFHWIQALNLSDSHAMSPLNSGPGIVCCEPVMKTRDADFTAFGAGCGRWLQFTVGGQGELGKTPLWSALFRAEQELNRADLQVAPDEADKLTSILGVTHAAVGELTGTPDQAALTYRLLELPDRKPVGAAIKISGTQAQILAGLPALARQLSLRLGVVHPTIPAAVGASPAEARLLGSLPLGTGAPLSSVQSKALRVLAPRLLLAALMRLHCGDWRYEDDTDALIKSAVAQAPQNTLLYGGIAWTDPAGLQNVLPQFVRVCCAFPRSYLLARALLARNRVTGDTAAVGAAAVLATRCAPQNSDAWLALGSTLSDMGDALRDGRTWQDMTPGQQAVVRRIYPDWQAAVSQAAQRDPLRWDAWMNVSQAAAFNGDRSVAQEAIQKALALNRADVGTLGWAMQLYQPKWYGSTRKLADVAKLAAAQDYPTIGETVSVYNDLTECGHTEEAKTMITRLVPVYQQAVERAPNDAQARYNLAEVLLRQPRYSLAIKQMQEVVQLRPNDTESRSDLGAMLQERGRAEEALHEYQIVLRRRPDYFAALFGAGRCLKEQEKFAAAEPFLRKALQRRPADFGVNFALGEILIGQKKYAAAVPCFKVALRLNSSSIQAWLDLCLTLAETGHSAQAVKAGRYAVALEKQDGQADGQSYFLLAYACAKNKEKDEALSLAEKAAAMLGDTPGEHANMGDVLVETGRRAEARAEWQKTLKQDPQGEFGKYAREMLAKYPVK